MLKRIKLLFGIKTDNDKTACSDDSRSLSSPDLEIGLPISTVLAVNVELRKSTLNENSDKKLTKLANAMEALSSEKTGLHVTWLTQLQNIQKLEELIEKKNVINAKLMVDNSMLEASNNLMMHLVAENDKLSTRLKQIESVNIKMKLALSTAVKTLYQYSDSTADSPVMKSI